MLYHPFDSYFWKTKQVKITIALELPNGLAQRQRRDGRDATTIIAYSSKVRLRGAAEPLSAGAGVRRRLITPVRFEFIIHFDIAMVTKTSTIVAATSPIVAIANIHVARVRLEACLSDASADLTRALVCFSDASADFTRASACLASERSNSLEEYNSEATTKKRSLFPIFDWSRNSRSFGVHVSPASSIIDIA